MCWIAGSSLAVCKFDSHSPVYLTGHTLPLVTLTTNQRNLVVTGAEDNTLRVWDLRTLSCVQIIEGVDVLDCAIHEDWLASYNNDNIIQVWHLGVGRRRQTLQVDVHSFDDIDGRVFTREVKIAIWGDRVVCGFENSVFMVICRHSGDLLHTLSEPVAHHREEYDSTHYPTVLALYDSILISRGVRCHELCVWDLVEGQLLYRLSESFSFQDIVGFPTRPNEVITDFTLDARGTFLMCTVENEAGDVYLLAWDFRKGGSKERERQFVKRSLEYVAGDWMQLEYKNYWLCYETS
ncbi:hypothetical protein DFS34DRAFT_600858 [Phlyctochytrium arcticum]|nr:hypothetical protein DFS34DRAFT_600858 [Phlyctochytrium arcticum]